MQKMVMRHAAVVSPVPYRQYGLLQSTCVQGYYTSNREEALRIGTGSMPLASFDIRFQRLKQAHIQSQHPGHIQDQ